MTEMAIMVNTTSGTGSNPDLRERLAEALRRHGLHAEILFARNGAEIIAFARKALAGGCRRLVAGGGDGTVSAIASLVAGTGRELGVLPFGTLNHFAKDLGIPLDVDGALRTLAEGRAIDIDAGEVNGRIFINNSSLGLYPYMVQHREKQRERLGRSKWMALLWASLAALGRYPFLSARIVADGEEMTTRTPLIFIGNNDYELHGFDLGTRKRLDSGELWIYLPHRVGRFRLIWLAARALFGWLRDAEDFDAIRTSEIRIESRRRTLDVALDGEVLPMETPLCYRIRKGALRVIVPHTITTRS